MTCSTISHRFLLEIKMHPQTTFKKATALFLLLHEPHRNPSIGCFVQPPFAPNRPLPNTIVATPNDDNAPTVNHRIIKTRVSSKVSSSAALIGDEWLGLLVVVSIMGAMAHQEQRLIRLNHNRLTEAAKASTAAVTGAFPKSARIYVRFPLSQIMHQNRVRHQMLLFEGTPRHPLTMCHRVVHHPHRVRLAVHW